MATELDLDLLQCDAGDGRPAVGIGRRHYPWPATDGPWQACCQPCLNKHDGDLDYSFTRWRPHHHDPAAGSRPDPAADQPPPADPDLDRP